MGNETGGSLFDIFPNAARVTVSGNGTKKRLVMTKGGGVTVEDVAARRKPRQEEHQIQAACVRWFEMQYPEYDGLLFAVPNGGRRDKQTGALLREEGVRAGVSDLLLLVPSVRYHGLCVEMKAAEGRQRPSQKEWQKKVERQGYRYALCRSLDDFMKVVSDYMYLM